MSVIIKDMKMPEDCRVCPMQIYDSYSGETKCRAIDKILAEDYKTIPFDGRPEWCPLIEIPEDARMIDANKLMKKIKQIEYNSIMMRDIYPGFRCDAIEWWCVEDLVNKSPTVIETEVE